MKLFALKFQEIYSSYICIVHVYVTDFANLIFHHCLCSQNPHIGHFGDNLQNSLFLVAPECPQYMQIVYLCPLCIHVCVVCVHMCANLCVKCLYTVDRENFSVKDFL